MYERPLAVRLLWLAFALLSAVMVFLTLAGVGFLVSFAGSPTALYLVPGAHFLGLALGLLGTELVLAWQPTLRSVLLLAGALLGAHGIAAWAAWWRFSPELWLMLIGPIALAVVVMAETAARLMTVRPR